MANFNFLSLAFACVVFVGCNEQHSKSTDEKAVPKIAAVIPRASADTSLQMMGEDIFWKIIDNSRTASSNNYQQQIISLQQILTSLDTNEILRFHSRFTELLSSSYDYKLWGASYVINGGCSDDCFDYFREYLIAHGKDKYYAAIKDPESCVNWIKTEEQDNWEGIRNASLKAYEAKTGKIMPGTYQPKFELKGKPFDEDELNKQYPRLAKKFNGESDSKE